MDLPVNLNECLEPWRDPSQHISSLLVLAGTHTSEQEGISAAGAGAALGGPSQGGASLVWAPFRG